MQCASVFLDEIYQNKWSLVDYGILLKTPERSEFIYEF